MPAITYRLTSVCAGGNHYTLELSGAVTRTLVVERDDLARLDDIDPETFALALLRFFGSNRSASARSPSATRRRPPPLWRCSSAGRTRRGAPC